MSAHFKQVEWSNGSNIYEVNIRQYTPEGTFVAFAKHLPRLKKMGVEIIWFMPITPISKEKRQGSLGSYYACSSYVKINPEYGDFEDFKNVVNEIHALGMKVIIDWVANHTGWDHEWTKSNPEFYLRDDAGNFTEKNGWEDVIGLNFTNDHLHNTMMSAMKFWVEKFDIDGFRCDMAHLVPLNFWREARSKCDELKPLYWLAECEDKKYFEVFDTEYAWAWMHVSEGVAKQKNTMHEMRDVLRNYAGFPGKYLLFTSNHDENSWNGTDKEKYGEALEAFAVLASAWPGIFLLYSGQEIPLSKRLLFFEKDAINWEQELKMEEFYLQLYTLRKANSCIQNEAEIFLLENEADDKIFSFLSVNKKESMLVILNLSAFDRIKATVTHENLKGNYIEYFSGVQEKINVSKTLTLNAWEYKIYISGEKNAG